MCASCVFVYVNVFWQNFTYTILQLQDSMVGCWLLIWLVKIMIKFSKSLAILWYQCTFYAWALDWHKMQYSPMWWTGPMQAGVISYGYMCAPFVLLVLFEKGWIMYLQEDECHFKELLHTLDMVLRVLQCWQN